MSISVPLAVTMMIGTCESGRMARHTSTPDILGKHDVEQHEIRFEGVEHGQRLGPVAGDGDVEALAPEPDDERVDEGLLVLGHEDRHRPAGGGDVVAAPAGRAGRGIGRRGPCPGRAAWPDCAPGELLTT